MRAVIGRRPGTSILIAASVVLGLGAGRLAAEDLAHARLSPWLGAWTSARASAQLLLAVRAIHSEPDGVWCEFAPEVAGTPPRRLQVTADGATETVYATERAEGIAPRIHTVTVADTGELVFTPLGVEPHERVRWEWPVGGVWHAHREIQGDDGAWASNESVELRSRIVRVEVDAISFVVPRAWERSTEHQPNELAVLVLPRPAPEIPRDARLALYDFGREGAGPTEGVLARWRSQVHDLQGEVHERCERVGALVIYGLVATGVYVDAQGRQPDSTLYAVIVAGGERPLYLKAVGPAAVIRAWESDLDALVASLQVPPAAADPVPPLSLDPPETPQPR